MRTTPSLATAALLAISLDTRAQGHAVVLGESLAVAGALGGLTLGAIAGWIGANRLRLWPSFGIYLGIVCVVASTRFGSMEVVPLTLVFGAAAGVLPYAASYLIARGLVARLRHPQRPPASSSE
jgi:hypothetical protein